MIPFPTASFHELLSARLEGQGPLECDSKAEELESGEKDAVCCMQSSY